MELQTKEINCSYKMEKLVELKVKRCCLLLLSGDAENSPVAHVIVRIASKFGQGAAVAKSVESSAPDRRARVRGSPGENCHVR